jgi:hypothetical protein
VNAHRTQYHIVEEVSLSELSIFQWKGKGVGAPSDIISWTTSGTIPCFTSTRTWRKSNRISCCLTRHIRNEVDNLH